MRLVDGHAVLRQATRALTPTDKATCLEISLKLREEAVRLVAVDQRQRVRAELVDGLVPDVRSIRLRVDARGHELLSIAEYFDQVADVRVHDPQPHPLERLFGAVEK